MPVQPSAFSLVSIKSVPVRKGKVASDGKHALKLQRFSLFASIIDVNSSRLNSASTAFAKSRTFSLYLFFSFLEGGDDEGRRVRAFFRQNFRRSPSNFRATANFRFFPFCAFILFYLFVYRLFIFFATKNGLSLLRRFSK
jgi:hypothetical protein